MTDRDDTAGAAEGSGAPDPFGRTDPPLFEQTLWAHRSLDESGARRVVGVTALGLAIPLIPFLGTPVAWLLLPYLLLALVALYWAIRRSWRDSDLHEVVRVWPDLITVEHMPPRGAVKRWHANPFWVDLCLHDGARIESYLTLRGNGREIELGAFLSPEERVALHGDLARWIGRQSA